VLAWVLIAKKQPARAQAEVAVPLAVEA
jgi:hypothetical protein